MLKDISSVLCSILVILTVVVLLMVMPKKSYAIDIKYDVIRRSDGGYTLNIVVLKRHWKPITAEGFFPLERQNYTIDFIGKGEDLSYRNKKGFYYALDFIKSKQHGGWDFGYAWVDEERKHLYINLYWIVPPDDLSPAYVNGNYSLTEKVSSE